jgi:hypothetical protein
MPVPGGTSGARDQDEGPHQNPSKSGGQAWETTILHRVSPNVLEQRLWRSRSGGHRAPTAPHVSAMGRERTLSQIRRSSDDPVRRSCRGQAQPGDEELEGAVAVRGAAILAWFRAACARLIQRAGAVSPRVRGWLCPGRSWLTVRVRSGSCCWASIEFMFELMVFSSCSVWDAVRREHVWGVGEGTAQVESRLDPSCVMLVVSR